MCIQPSSALRHPYRRHGLIGMGWSLGALKFEEERSRMRSEIRLSVARKDEILEEAGIKKPRVRLAGFHTVAWVTRERGDGEFFPHLETHLKVFRDLVEVVFELIGGRWPVEGRIVPDGAKERFSVVEILAVLA